MTWAPTLRLEIELEFRALADANRFFREVYAHEQAKAEERRKLGPKAIRAREDAARQRARSDANIEAARAAGDIRKVRRLEAWRRGKKARKA